ncbi:MAG: NADP-dependent oxidoreductase [Tolumonas sp.]|nr:NADP-dependent oxidoreductase [Tolumonas sp.]
MAQLQMTRFGGVDVLQLSEQALSAPAAEQVLLDVLFASVNPIDVKTRAGLGWAAQKYQDRLPWTPGFDVCGVVNAVGADVTALTVGQRVCGMTFDGGAYASTMLAPAVELLPVPKNMTHAQAAALPLAGLTAWQGLFEHGQLQAGETVLISAAAGGVGHIGVQLAKQAGATVIATASETHHDFLRQLGADQVVDYHDPAAMAALTGQVDLVFDLVGFESGLQALSLLKEGGRQITVPTVAVPAIKAVADTQGKTVSGMLVHPDRDGLAALLALCADGKLQVHVSKIYPLTEGAKAHLAIESGHTRGKLLLDPSQQEL